MPTDEELRKAMAARASRKALENARVDHDIKVRDSFEDYYKKEMEALRQKRAHDRYAEDARRKQEEEAARLARRQRTADDRQKIESAQNARDSAEWRAIAKNVAQRVRGLTVSRVLEEMEKVRATGFTPKNWTGFMVWRLSNASRAGSARGMTNKR